MLGFVRAHITDIFIVSKRLGLMMSFITGALKLVCMIVYHEDILELFKILDEHYNKMINNVKLAKIVLNGVTVFKRLSWAVSLLVFISGCVNIITPIVFIIFQHTHHIQPTQYILPYLSIYPWVITPNGFLYKIHYTFETLATFSLIAITSSVEPLFTLYVIQMIGCLRVLSYQMLHIDESNNSERVIRESVIQYEILLKCRNIVQKIFGPIILWMIITSAVILCLDFVTDVSNRNWSIPQLHEHVLEM
ncbi:hypothetical protein PV327_008079 [Microctonus hyperodae]|uniref:Odorant receptor n=1 Tax=Microctonus hyperodae TaxID=165561 RepID=A0AA39F2C7_MICHY|nr:hypothetical protein PV327_008079 [Microctonus hyperodae]